MTNITALLAQSGIGDVPEVLLFLMLCLWPYHVSSALGITSYYMSLVGYGPMAVALQTTMLLLLFLSFVLIIRSPQPPRWFKRLFLPVGYPFVILVTNLIPGFL
jgi:hypothetical protein